MDTIEKANRAVPVRELMNSWIWQPGYPLISARLDGAELVLNQQRFAYADIVDPTLFVVPVNLSIDGVESKLVHDRARLACRSRRPMHRSSSMPAATVSCVSRTTMHCVPVSAAMH